MTSLPSLFLCSIPKECSMTEDEVCCLCGGSLSWTHDHQPDNSGLDDGPFLRTPRKKMTPKSVFVAREIRLRAWITRRQKYGQRGHR